MKKMLVLLLLLMAQFAVADIVTYPLSCAGTYDENSSEWSTQFDLGVTFTEITQVSIQWSGTMEAALVALPGRMEVWDAIISASLWFHPGYAFATAEAGAATDPDPEPFDCASIFTDLDESEIATLLDGTGEIHIGYESHIFSLDAGGYLNHGEILLNDATLVFEGTVVPEPMSMAMLLVGTVSLLRKRKFYK